MRFFFFCSGGRNEVCFRRDTGVVEVCGECSELEEGQRDRQANGRGQRRRGRQRTSAQKKRQAFTHFWSCPVGCWVVLAHAGGCSQATGADRTFTTLAALQMGPVDDYGTFLRNCKPLCRFCANSSCIVYTALSHLAKPEELGGWCFFLFFYLIFCFLSMAPRQGQARFSGVVN